MKVFQFTSIICSILFHSAQAQDTIYYKSDGQELVEIQEISNSNLVFTLHGEADGAKARC